MARKQSHFNLDIWDKAEQTIENLPEKQKTEVKASIKDGLYRIKNSINKAKKMGYTHEEILETLRNVGIDISLSSFKSYIDKKSKRKKRVTILDTSTETNKPIIKKIKKASTKSNFSTDDDV